MGDQLPTSTLNAIPETRSSPPPPSYTAPTPITNPPPAPSTSRRLSTLIQSSIPPPYETTLSRTASRGFQYDAATAPLPSSLNRRRSSSIFSGKSGKEKATIKDDDAADFIPPLVDPQTQLPPSFRVGLRHVKPYVGIGELTDHLLLLAAIDKFQTAVKDSAIREAFSSPTDPNTIPSRSEEEDLNSLLAALNLHTTLNPSSPPTGQGQLAAKMSPDIAFSLLTKLAEHQFEEWVRDLAARPRGEWKTSEGRVREWTGEELPRGLGAVMVWHSYVLNPRWYYEDTMNRQELLPLRSKPFPLKLIASCIDPHTLAYHPPSTPAPLPAPTVRDLLTTEIFIPCPACDTVLPVPLVVPPESQDRHVGGHHFGIAQADFRAWCSNSQCILSEHGGELVNRSEGPVSRYSVKYRITHETMRVGKFLRDIRSIATGSMEYLPGMRIRPSSGLDDTDRPRLFSQLIARMFYSHFDRDVNLFPLQRNGKPFKHRTKDTVVKLNDCRRDVKPYTLTDIQYGKAFGGSVNRRPIVMSIQGMIHGLNDTLPPLKFSSYESAIHTAVEDGHFKTWVGGFRLAGDQFARRLGKMWSAYQSTGLASLGLAEAVQRQAGFIEKMREMGWLEEGRFERNAFLLQKSVARYHAFLDLMAVLPAGFLCPTLDIDLGWHTHQLQNDKYRQDTISAIARFVDHDDKVSETRLGDAYAYTAKAWLKRFGVPYSACGCHQGNGVAGILNSGFGVPTALRFWSKDKESKDDRKKRFVLEMHREMTEEEKHSTHPSTHNSVRVTGLSHIDRERSNRIREAARWDSNGRPTRMNDLDADIHVALSKQPGHADPFVYNPPNYASLYPTQAHQQSALDEKSRMRAQAGDLSGLGMGWERGTGRGRPYWGVAMGAGAGLLFVGGAYAWGLSQDDCHDVDGNYLCNNRGACAVGVGAGGGGYCSATGGGDAGSGGGSGAACGGGACSTGGCASSGGACGGGSGGGGCGGGGGGGGCGGGGGGGGGCGGGGS